MREQGVGIVFNPKKEGVREVLKEVSTFLQKKGVRIKFLPGGEKFGFRRYVVSKGKFLRETSLVIAIGGDGTILASAHLVGERGIPIMGINIGSLGFLAFFSPKEALTTLADFLKGKAKVEERMALKVSFQGKEYFALNDATVNMGYSLRAIEVILYSGKRYVSRFIGDGVIISTPTGSTAYSLACGGSIIYPTLSCFIITPIAPHALSARPLIVPAEEELRVELAKDSETGFLVIDGQRRLKISPGFRAKFLKAKRGINVVVPTRKDYFSILRQKMRWGGRGDE
ncbi:MAG: NAD(+)/NADH kinase [candidate division WOR-3 bacterium]